MIVVPSSFVMSPEYSLKKKGGVEGI